MINRKPRKRVLISNSSARPETRRTGSASFAIPTLFMVSSDKLDIKRLEHVILYYTDLLLYFLIVSVSVIANLITRSLLNISRPLLFDYDPIISTFPVRN